ncbi:UrcA family protein [Aurantiacibacter spongiae]|uniref:UrcA family protein n=1 Tax=Aurantiacibacter spongiae TaxID=2488860 RepID=A0A3N5DKU8_9SPHN|nr:UrcA family protein [Aurantiacibacter spongiae]RPF71415.1 UrcA family protein [Aurantiacibacter spongiae]
MIRSKSIVLALAAAGLTLSAGAQAAPEEQQRSTAVRYTDLDLATADGVEELDRRMDRAARYVCRYNETDVGTRIRSRETRDCVDRARAQLDRRFAQIKREARLGG